MSARTFLLARTVMVAEVYGALVSERPYKPAWSAEEALRELQRQAELRPDPALIRVLGNAWSRRAPEGRQFSRKVGAGSTPPRPPPLLAHTLEGVEVQSPLWREAVLT
ncbi:hypothetical protein [Deinococcus hopiensis]|uniref:hypothetical protein n=1 Tax=Deinococcus hopiensis TaxID=309885 RepID=UPI0009FD648B|nr:hypothetical protein [Deinococcus hopiensis]